MHPGRRGDQWESTPLGKVCVDLLSYVNFANANFLELQQRQRFSLLKIVLDGNALPSILNPFSHFKKTLTLAILPRIKNYRDVAQLGSALRSGRRGRWFESSHPDCFVI